MKKKKIIKVIVATISIIAWSIFTYYYKAPSKFSMENAIPIVIFTFFMFTATFSVAQLFTSQKNSLMISLTLVSTLFIKHYRIIPIITYAICIPLLYMSNRNAEDSIEEL
ncbi:MAG: hypothetical protein M3Q44_02775 [bacterium]|nr:hypothetical protein [bacterium]